MPASNLDILTAAFQRVNIIDETEVPSAEQGVVGLACMNDLLMEWDADGIQLGYFPQTNLAAQSPLQDEAIRCVKLCVAGEISAYYGMAIEPAVATEIQNAFTRLVKRSIQYLEADLSELPCAQGYWGGGGWGWG
jgi:hypothetical protein